MNIRSWTLDIFFAGRVVVSGVLQAYFLLCVLNENMSKIIFQRKIYVSLSANTLSLSVSPLSLWVIYSIWV